MMLIVLEVLRKIQRPGITCLSRTYDTYGPKVTTKHIMLRVGAESTAERGKTHIVPSGVHWRGVSRLSN